MVPIYTGGVVMKVKVYSVDWYTKVMICYNSNSPQWPGGLMCSSTIKLMFNQIFFIFKHCLDSVLPQISPYFFFFETDFFERKIFT